MPPVAKECYSKTEIYHSKVQAYAWAAQPWGVGGTMSPHFWDQWVQGGTGGPMKMVFASIADSLYSVLYK